MTYRIAALGLMLSGCFSAADFEDCTSDEQCGAARICNSGTCEFVDFEGDSAVRADAGLRPDARISPDMGLPIVRVTGEIAESLDFPDQRVEIRDVFSTSEVGFFSLQAQEVIIAGPLIADGRGGLGGGGGGGGAGGHGAHDLSGGAGGDANAQAGAGNTGTTGGGGGRGAQGGVKGGQNATAPAAGGAPGTSDNPNGQRGEDGKPLSLPCLVAPGQPVFGAGGGGGGGGAGGLGDGCNGGGSGGGGGAGGRGGGAVIITAQDRIIVRSRISARGLAAISVPADGTSGSACQGEADEMCLPCEGQGDGGAGAGPAGSQSGPGVGGGGDGASGGLGGAGSGGSIRLVAPQIIFEGDATLDVSGGGSQNGGVIYLDGTLLGSPGVQGHAPGADCRTE